MKEFNLTEKANKDFGNFSVWEEEDIKEFISKDWDLFMLFLDNKISFLELVDKRNKLAGEKFA